MAFGNIVVFIGQSLIVDNPGSTLFSHIPDRQYVFKMAGGTRILSNFGHGSNSSNSNWNTYLSTGVTTNSPVVKFADEWEARENGGWFSNGNLYVLVCGRSGASFAVQYGIDDSSQWNLERKRNLNSAWDGTYYSIPSDLGGGVYPTGASYSCVSTLTQTLSAMVSEIVLKGETPRLLFCCWAHGQADSFSLTAANAYENNENGLIDVIADTLGVSRAQIPWYSVLLSGEPLTRIGASIVNQAKRNVVSNLPLGKIIDPTLFIGYNPNDLSTYGGYHTDGTHLSDLASWRIADQCWNLGVNVNKFGSTL
jgi:hypothetical protein